MSSSCPACDLSVDSNSKAVQCRKCDKWIHYYCTQLPAYYIVLIAGSTISFTCETCVSDRFKDVFVLRHTEVDVAISAHKLLRAGPNSNVDNTESKNLDVSDSAVKNVPSTTIVDPPIETALPDTKERETSDPLSDPVEPDITVKSNCIFHLQGRCIHGRVGTGCKHSHPNLCKKFILKGEQGCSKGKECKDPHPPLCVHSLKNNTCARRRCFLYHVTGSSRPNLPKKKGVTSTSVQKPAKPSHDNDRPPSNQQPTPLVCPPSQMHMTNESSNVSFLEQMNEMRSQIQGILMMQRQLMQCVFPKAWPMSPNLDTVNWPQLPHHKPMPSQFVPPSHW